MMYVGSAEKRIFVITLSAIAHSFKKSKRPWFAPKGNSLTPAFVNQTWNQMEQMAARTKYWESRKNEAPQYWSGPFYSPMYYLFQFCVSTWFNVFQLCWQYPCFHWSIHPFRFAHSFLGQIFFESHVIPYSFIQLKSKMFFLWPVFQPGDRF